MRERHLSGHTKLSIIIIAVLISTAAFAKKKTKETNIVCFAAQNKWICAPEDKKNIANEKAQKLLEQKITETIPANIVIKPINIPKFETPDNSIISKSSDTSPAKPKAAVKTQTTKITPIPKNNPYAKLWAHQLIGVSTPNSAVNFVKNKHLNKEDILIIKSVRNEMDWWIILFGLYKDKQTGLDNVNNLPTSIKDPWLRPLKNLKVNGFIEDF